MAAIVAYTSWDFFLTSFGQNEGSSNYGGLPQWPVKFLIPLAFALLFLQGRVRADQALRHHQRRSARR